MNTGIMSSQKGKVAISGIIIAMFLFAFVYAQPVAASEYTPQSGTYQNISVQVAHHMIKTDKVNQVLILDVRYQCEYDMGHLYGAILIPYDQLEAKIGELQASKDHEIVVYCKSGYRSQIACEILANHSFARVYNMVGGILAWINAGYQIYTTNHYATVNIVDGEILLQIKPGLLYQTGPVPCEKNQTCQSCNPQTGNPPYNFTVLKQDKDHTVIHVTYETNGTTSEYTIAGTLLWIYNEFTDGVNRTAYFSSVEITRQNSFIQFYSLDYLAQHAEYNLTVHTILTPLDSQAYNRSMTTIKYVPASKSGLVSIESVDFNSSVTLSSQYAVLGKVAKEVGKIYEKSEDKTLSQLTPGYHTINTETRYLSFLVKQQLGAYDNEILHSSGTITDVCGDWLCLLICNVITYVGCGLGCWAICGLACSPLCAGCVVIIWCLSCFFCLGLCEGLCTRICHLPLGYGCDWVCCQV